MMVSVAFSSGDFAILTSLHFGDRDDLHGCYQGLVRVATASDDRIPRVATDVGNTYRVLLALAVHTGELHVITVTDVRVIHEADVTGSRAGSNSHRLGILCGDSDLTSAGGGGVVIKR